MNNKSVEALKGTKNIKNIRTWTKIAKDGKNIRVMEEKEGTSLGRGTKSYQTQDMWLLLPLEPRWD